MPRPSEVPRCGVRRPIAARTVAWSLVGCWTAMPESLKATTPMTTLGGWRWTKSVAAAIAAAIRVGWRSVAAMLPEMSKARMTVPSWRGTSIRPCGRASATTITVKPATRRTPGRAAGSGRRDAATARRCGGAVAGGRRPDVTPARAARRRAERPRPSERRDLAPLAPVDRAVGQEPERDEHQREQGLRPDEGHDTRRRRRRRAAIRTMARTRSSSVDSETASTPARRKASPMAASRSLGRRLEPAPEARIAGVDVELLAGLGVLEDDRPDVGQA